MHPFFFLLLIYTFGCSEIPVSVRDLAAYSVDGVDIPQYTECNDTMPTIYGRATYYNFADGGGNCMFDPTPDDLLVAAMNTTDYDSSYACGSYIHVDGPNSTSVNVRIVDRCVGCTKGSIDLSPLAFSMLADTMLGNIPVSWRVIPQDVQGPISYHFKDGSSKWWTAVQVRNHRYPVASLEYLGSGGTFIKVPRTMYNYFVQANGMGPGPYTFRITDMFGHILIDSNIVGGDNISVQGANQFPECHREY